MSAEQDLPRVPPGLHALVASDLRPVRTLPAPGVRALLVAPLAAVLLVAAPLVFWWRFDLDVVGWPLSWGASVLQAIVGLLVIAVAFRESVPGRSVSAPMLIAAIGGAGALLVLVTIATATVTHLAPGRPVRVGWLCFTGSFVSGVPAVAIAGLLAARAFPLRPIVTGALYGLGGGLMADAGWRLFCEFSAPAHVFPFHLGAVIANLLLGMAWAGLLARRRRRLVS